MTAENSQTLDRGLRVLSCVAESSDGLTVTELASALGVGRSVVHRLVVTLVQRGLLRKSTGSRYVCAPALAALGRAATRTVRADVTPALRRVTDGSAAHFIAFDSDEIALLASSDTHPEPRMAAGPELLAAARGACAAVENMVVVVEGGLTHVAAPVRGVEGLDGVVIVLAVTDVEAVLPKILRAVDEISRVLL